MEAVKQIAFIYQIFKEFNLWKSLPIIADIKAII